MKVFGDDTTLRIDLLNPTHAIPPGHPLDNRPLRTVTHAGSLEPIRLNLMLHLESMPLAVVITSPEGVINESNKPAELFLGLPTDLGLQRNLAEFIPGLTSERFGYLLNVLREGRSVMLDGMVQTVAGATVPVEVAVSLCGGHGEELCFILHDVQHLRDTEQALDQVQQRIAKAERLAAAGTVSGQIAHDFNNLLTPMLAFPSLIRRELQDGSPALEYLRVLEKTAEDMAHMTQQLLALSRRGNVGDELFNLNDVVQHVFALMRNDPPPADIEMVAELADDLLPIRGGSDQLLRVVQNLCQNAVDAMEEGGRLHVVTENVYLEAPVGKYDTVDPGEYVRVAIKDTGPGIPEEIRDKVFEPFYTTKRGNKRRGSGLGLSIVHGIIKDHKGYIDLESEVGEGTTFYLYLPVCRGDIVVVPEDAIYSEQGETILAIDDDPSQLQVVVKLLEALNYKAHGVASGEAALDWLEAHCGECDLVIVDMCMEPGMNGCDTWRAIHQRYPRIASILMSGFLRPLSLIDTAKREGAGRYLKKPLTLAMIGEAVHSELGRRLSVADGDEAPDSEAGPSPELEAAPRPSSRRVLLVDDEESIRRMFALVLASFIPDIEVFQAGNGKEALELFKETPCDVIVMDLNMPVMDGRQAFIRLREYCRAKDTPMPPVIFCTGFASPDFLKEVVDGNEVHALLHKPVRLDVLVKTVQERMPAS